jgi:vacuolar-type H+-ATPase subunit F/Vma7
MSGQAQHKEKIAVIADSATCTGFRLAGAENTFVLSGKEAEERLASLLSDPSYGIIIVTERLLENCDWRLKKRVEATAKPIVVPIPDAQGPIEQEESLAMLIKRALGVDLSKKK